MKSSKKRARRRRTVVVSEPASKKHRFPPVIAFAGLVTVLLSVAATAGAILPARQSLTLPERHSLAAMTPPITGMPKTLKWDFDNKLTAVDTDDNATDDVTYTYDALGRRVSRNDGMKETVFVHSGEQVVADYTKGMVPASPDHTYVYGSYVDEPVVRDGPEGKRYFHANQQHSIVALTDETGSVKERYAYDAYGTPTILDSTASVIPTSAEANRYLHTGREWDEDASLYNYRTRTYDPDSGRFCSRDPIGYLGSMWNLYEFLECMPLSAVDPSGESIMRPQGPPEPRVPPLAPPPPDPRIKESVCKKECKKDLERMRKYLKRKSKEDSEDCWDEYLECTCSFEACSKQLDDCYAEEDEMDKKRRKIFEPRSKKDYKQCVKNCIIN